ncbi:MAG: NADP-dependent oxidoreductase [Haloarculaceae archaeon]
MEDTNRQVRLASRPEGMPSTDDFETVETDVPAPGDGEVLVRTRYLSVDPYMRGRMRATTTYHEPWAVGEVLEGGVVGDVVASNHPGVAAGDVVTGRLDWADYGVADGAELTPVDPDLAPVSTALGVLGMPGRTAYFGMLDVAEPRPGDTVVVSGAAGAVGSVAGQIAALGGCRVVGIAGSSEKVAYLTGDLGFDAGVNYRRDEYPADLAEACPDGVDVYFDNVGGEVTDAVVPLVNDRVRIALCGQIALYNEEETPQGPRHFLKLSRTQCRVRGFSVRNYQDRTREANERLADWVRAGELEYRESVVEGLENAPEAFLGLFRGENVGKQLVRVRA